MKKLLLLALLWPSLLAAQPAPTVVSKLRTTDTSTTSIRVGCTLAGTCTGGITSGPIDVSSITSAGFVEIASNIPASETNRLVNHAGTLYFNGVGLATGASLSGTLNAIPVFTGASSVGNSIMAQNVGATIITVTGALNATVTLGGTLSTATQNSVTTMTGLTSVGTIATGTWNATIIGLSKGGTGVSLAGTGGTSQFLRQNTVGGTVTVVRPAVADLSDASNVALLNAANLFTANQTIRPAGANAILTLGGSPTNNSAASLEMTPSSTAINWAIRSNWNIAGALEFLPSTAAGGTTISSTAAFSIGPTGILNLGAGPRWGINAAGDFTFGASSHIADAVSTPTIASGFGTSPSIAGTAYAFVVTNGTPAGNGVVNFGTTFSSAPVCVGNTEFTTTAVGILTSTTQATIGLTGGGTNAGKVYVLCRGY